MESRTTSKKVTFRNPFWVSGLDTRQAAGTYKVETEEELLDARTFVAWRLVSTHITISKDGVTESVRINRDELEDALARDALSPL